MKGRESSISSRASSIGRTSDRPKSELHKTCEKILGMVEKNSEELEKLKKKIHGIDVKYAETEEVIAKMSVEERPPGILLP